MRIDLLLDAWPSVAMLREMRGSAVVAHAHVLAALQRLSRG